MNKELNSILNNNLSTVEIFPTLTSFIFCIFASFLLRELYLRKSFSQNGKKQIGSILPILSTVVFVIIVIIKSSLALSLGLVGALSIVRFRTPIKEPEELVYLFLAISIGIGYGSGQILITTILILIMFLVIFIWLSNRKINSNLEYNLIINWKSINLETSTLLNQIDNLSDGYKLLRSEIGENENTLVLIVYPKEKNFIDELNKNMKTIDKSINLTFFESNSNW
tara:strand:+ start:165 stop:839 length:675 start_codon:yes stop_codon:yes gene_type:complete